MNACILFILLNGSVWATDGCWSPNGYMLTPQDVVYTQRIPYYYNTRVYNPPRWWASEWRPWARSWRNWDGYRYSPRHGRRWIRHRRWLKQRGQRRWNQGYRQGRRDANVRRVNRRNERKMNKKSRNGNRRGKKHKNGRKNRR